MATGLGDEIGWWSPTNDTARAYTLLTDLGSSGNDATGVATDSGDLVDDGGGLWHMAIDGTAEYMHVGDIPAFEFEYTDDFSVSMWANVPQADPTGYMIANMKTLSPYRGWGIYSSSDGVQVSIRNLHSPANDIKRKVLSTTYDPKDTFAHYCFTWSGNATPVASDLTIYIDGAERTSSVLSDTLSATIVQASTHLCIGAYRYQTTASSFLNMSFDDVRIFDRVLTAEEVAHLGSARGVEGTPGNILPAAYHHYQRNLA